MADQPTCQIPPTSPTHSDKVPLINKLAFRAGDVGPAIAMALMGFYLLFFLTDVAGLSPGVAGITCWWSNQDERTRPQPSALHQG